MVNVNKESKIFDIKEKKLVGIDKWIIDLYFLEGYIKRSIKIFTINSNHAEFIQTRVLLDKYWTPGSKNINLKFLSMIKEDESYFLDNLFLYDYPIFFKMNLKDYDEECNYVYSSVVHPLLFILNLAILLYFQDNRKSEYSSRVYTKYNFNYEQEGIDFLSTNELAFKEKYNKISETWKCIVKINIKNLYSSIEADVLRKFSYEKYNIKWEILETIINYSKNICSDGNKIIPTLEFSPLYSYLSTSCVLEGVIEEFHKSLSIQANIINYDDEIYLFFNNPDDWPNLKFILESILFKYKLRSIYQNFEIIKINGKLLKNNSEKIKFSDFYINLLEHFKNKEIFVDSGNIFLDYLKKYNLENPFYNFDVDDVSLDDYKNILKIINSNYDNYYFRIVDSNPKHFIRLFYLLDKKYSSYVLGDYLLKKIVLKFKYYKYNSETINEDYYLYYYLYNSFKGLHDNYIEDEKFIENIDHNYVNFQKFIKDIYTTYQYSDFKINGNSNLKIRHNKLVSSLLFFLRNQFILNSYNDCILIVSTLYDLIKNEFKNSFSVKDYKAFINQLNENILPNYNISKIVLDYWDYLNKLRNNLSSCHFGNNSDKKFDNFNLDDLNVSLLNIIKWIFSYSRVKFNNNLNKLLFCLKAESNKRK